MNTYHPHKHHAYRTATAERSQAHASDAQRKSPRLLSSQSRTWTGPAKADRAAPVPPRGSTAEQCEYSTHLGDCAVDHELVLVCTLDLELFPPCVPQRRASDVPTSQPRRMAGTARKPDEGLCARGDAARNAQQADSAVYGNAERWRQQEMGL